LTRSPSQNIIWITARDKITGEILKCETKISLVNNLEIDTELPEVVDVGSIRVLRAIGKDFLNNSISSLEGLRFEWTIE